MHKYITKHLNIYKMRQLKTIISLVSFYLIASYAFSGCATVFSGYYDNVEIIGGGEGIKVVTNDGVSLPVYKKKITEWVLENNSTHRADQDWFTERKKIQKTIYYVKLRTNKNYVLMIYNQGQQKTIEVFPKLSGWWFFFDIFPGGLLGGIPLFIDYYTSNWNTFDEIEIGQ